MKAEAPPMPASSDKARQWMPLALLAALIAGAYTLGLQRYLTLESLVENHASLQAFVSDNFILAVAIYAAVYILVVALSLPAAGLLSIVGGFVFGWLVSAPVTVIAATIGAVIVFQIVKTSLGKTLAERAGPFVTKLSDGFAKDSFNYLLFLRLVPAFPFFAVNAVAGLCRVDLKTFVTATIIGIIPGSFAFAWLGRGLGSLIESQQRAFDICVAAQGAANCHLKLSVTDLVTKEILIAFALLGVVALIPVVLRKLKGNP
jgi:uncharacterized membrane protein YdjX (TVP38/TMEM64 family)